MIDSGKVSYERRGQAAVMMITRPGQRNAIDVETAEALRRGYRVFEADDTAQVLQEFFVNATRKVAAPLTPEAAVDRLRSLSRWRVHSPLADDVVAAASLSHRHQLSFWDAMIVRSAAELHCAILWSEDLNDGQLIEGVRVRNPFR